MLRPGETKQEIYNILKRITKYDEKKWLFNYYNYAMLGDWLNFDNLIKTGFC